MANNNNQNLELQPYKKNVSFKYEKLQLPNEYENNENDVLFNLWDNSFELSKKMHISDDLKIHYENKVFKLQIDNVNGTIQGGQVEKITYFRPTSLIQTGLIYDMFSVLEDKLCEKLNINFLDIVDRMGMFRLNCKQEVPLDKVVYLKDVIVNFNRVDRVNYRGKIKYCIVCDVIKGDILLQR